MRAQAMGHTGDPNVRTPNIDRLALEGVNFTQAISGTPLCCPFRGSLVTGRYPHRSTVPGHDYSMDPNMPTVAHAFRNAGYRTCWIGKWHLDGSHEPNPGLDFWQYENTKRTRIIPPERRGGFEDWWAYEINNRPFDCWIHTDTKGSMESYRVPGFASDGLTDILIDWMKGRVQDEPDQPFFASLSLEPPHNPYTAPAEYMEKYRAADLKLRPNVPDVKWVRDRVNRELPGYYAAIENLDWNVGRIRAALDELGIAEETYIIFFSDHGDLHGSQGQFLKTSPWEEAIRIPFIVSGPSREHQFYQWGDLDIPINHVDIAPTTLGMCGIAKPDQMDGFDYSAYIRNKFTSNDPMPMDDIPDSAYLSLPVPTLHGDSVDKQFRGIVTRDGWKYVALEGHAWLMFNLNEDPYEQVNLAHNAKFSQQRTKLNDQLKRWVMETEDEFAVPE